MPVRLDGDRPGRRREVPARLDRPKAPPVSEWLYQIPTWLLGLLIVGGAAAVAAAGCLLVERWLPSALRMRHNDVAGAVSNIVGVVYAVIIAFLAIAVWEDFGKAETTVQTEANAVSDVYRSARGYPEATTRRVREGLEEYVRLVVQEEWKLLERGRASERAWLTLERVHRQLLDFEPRTPREQVIHAEQLRHFNIVLDQRRTRLRMAESGLQPVVWAVMLAGSALTVGFVYFFGTENRRFHVAMAAILGAAIGLVLFLIVAMNYPFRGAVSIDPDAFVRVQENFKRLTAEQN